MFLNSSNQPSVFELEAGFLRIYNLRTSIFVSEDISTRKLHLILCRFSAIFKFLVSVFFCF